MSIAKNKDLRSITSKSKKNLQWKLFIQNSTIFLVRALLPRITIQIKGERDKFKEFDDCDILSPSANQSLINKRSIIEQMKFLLYKERKRISSLIWLNVRSASRIGNRSICRQKIQMANVVS